MGKKRGSATIPAVPAKKLRLSSNDGTPETQAGGGGRGEEQDFPRGGHSVLTPLEKRVIREQATKDTLFNESGGGRDEGEETESTAKQPKKKSAAGRAVGSQRSQRRVETLTPKSLEAGVLVLGAVQEVRDLEVSVSLPCNMCGTVAIGNVSDPLTEGVVEELEEEEEREKEAYSILRRVFFPGQLVVCCVLGEGGRGKREGRRKGARGFDLTVNPRVVNTHLSPRDILEGMVLPGWVKSVEDHGYIIDFGVENKMGFLLRKNASEFVKTSRGKSLVQGQVVRCKVLSAVDARSVPVSVEPSVVGGALVGGDSLVQLHALQPGLLVNTTVKEVRSNGVVVTFLGGLEGSVGLRHLPSWEAPPTSLPPRKKVRGRLLWVDVEGKRVGVSLQRTLVDGRSFAFPGVEFGDVFEDAEIVKIFPDSSLLLRLSPDCLGFCPLPLASDEGREKSHRVGTRHPCRVVQFNLIDGTAIVSLQPSVLSQRYLRYADISVGDLLEATVERHGSFGMIVSIQDSLRGLCPATHLSDGLLRDPQRKLPEGKPVKCRVMHVAADEKRVLLTCKKSLLRLGEGEVLSDYAQAEVGRVVRGVVSRIHSHGFSVFFFNNVMGYVAKSEMTGGHGVSFPEPSSVVRPGQVVECRVLACEPQTRKLRLSMRLEREEVRDVALGNHLLPGRRVGGEVTGVAGDGVSLRCRETGEVGFLPIQHLSDYPSLCGGMLSQHQHSLEAAIREGRSYELDDVLVVCGRQSTRPALLSLKPSLLQSAALGWVEHHSQLKPDQLLTGFIKKVMSYGCFVEFPHNLSALAPSKYLQDEFTSDPSLVYCEGQTIFARVLEVNLDKKRFLVSLRPSDVRLCGQSRGLEGEEGEEGRRKLGERLERFLAEREAVVGTDPPAQPLSPGAVLRGRVISVEEREVEMELEGGLPGKATTHTAPGVRVGVGEEVVGCVLEVEGDAVRVSLNPALVEGSDTRREEEGEEGRRKKRKSAVNRQAMLQGGVSVMGTVELATPHYLLVTLRTLSGSLLAYAATDSGQLEVLSASHPNIKTGQKVTAVVYSPASESRGKRCGLPIVVVTGTRGSSSNESGGASSKPSFMNVKTGDIINVIVKGVKTAFLSVRYHLWQGRVHCCLAKDTPCPGHTPFAEVHPGDVVRARVVGMRKKEVKRLGSKKGATITTLELTTRESLLDPTVELRRGQLLRGRFKEGEELFGFVHEVGVKNVSVHLSPRALGHVPLMLAHTDHTVLRDLKRHFAEGEAVRCWVVSGRRRGSQPVLSIIGGVSTPTVGSVVECLVSETTPLCLVVSVPWWAGFGRIDITDLADKYSEEPLRQFGGRRESVRCCVVRVSGDQMDLSLRPSRLSGLPVGDSQDREITSLEDLPEGSVVRGYVKAVTAVGLFVRLGRGLDGRVQIKHLADGFVKNYREKFREGQLVKAKVISVDVTRGQVELSFRLSHIDPAAAKRERRKADRERARREEGEEGESDGGSESSESCAEEEESEGEGSEEGDGEEEVRPTLQLSGLKGFVWERGERDREAENSGPDQEKGDGEKEAVSSKKTRRQKKAALKAEEEQLYQTERAQLEESRAPENVEDFERLLLSRPNSSALWVQYMAFLLQTAEVDKARTVGEKALQVISFREEGEKLNVWVARLNLENLYGSQESLMAVFQAALQQNDPLEVSRRLATIYQDSDKMELAEQLHQTMTRQFRSELSVWAEFGLFLMKRGRLEGARRLLQRCLKALPLKQQHVEVISRFAQWEFRYGDAGRGATMFESLVTSYPRRTDLWSVYVDLLVKARQTDQAREVLERAVHLKLSAKKMKLMFKRYLEFERQHGSPAGVEAVKDKARTFVEAKLAQQGL